MKIFVGIAHSFLFKIVEGRGGSRNVKVNQPNISND